MSMVDDGELPPGVIDLRQFDDDSFVVHFGGPISEIDATTFGAALIALADGLRAINNEINPGFAISVTIDAVGPGSFRARLKASKRSLKNLFSSAAKNIIFGILASLIYDKVFDPSEPPTIVVEGDTVIVRYEGSTTIILSKEVYDAKRQVEKNPEIDRSIARTIEAVEQNPSVTTLGFTPHLGDKEPVVEIPRALFPEILRHSLSPQSDDRRTEDVRTNLVVLKAVFERSRRKWEFIWNGIKISAPIVDPTFFDRLGSRQISLHQGDAIEATLRIWKHLDPLTGAWLNERYEIISVGAVTYRAPEQTVLSRVSLRDFVVGSSPEGQSLPKPSEADRNNEGAGE